MHKLLTFIRLSDQIYRIRLLNMGLLFGLLPPISTLSTIQQYLARSFP